MEENKSTTVVRFLSLDGHGDEEIQQVREGVESGQTHREPGDAHHPPNACLLRRLNDVLRPDVVDVIRVSPLLVLLRMGPEVPRLGKARSATVLGRGEGGEESGGSGVCWGGGQAYPAMKKGWRQQCCRCSRGIACAGTYYQADVCTSSDIGRQNK